MARKIIFQGNEDTNDAQAVSSDPLQKLPLQDEQEHSQDQLEGEAYPVSDIVLKTFETLGYHYLRMGVKFPILFLLCGILYFDGVEAAAVAICNFRPMEGESANITGKAVFSQEDASANLVVNVTDVKGLDIGKHGFHMHNGTECVDPGPHFNPEQQKHGFLEETDRDYHVGDFGNIDVVDVSAFEPKTYTVPHSIAGLFDESNNKVFHGICPGTNNSN